MNAEQKAHKILAEARLTVRHVSVDGGVVAECRGFSDGEVYALGFIPESGRWHCTCRANAQFGRTCAHLMALTLVCVKPRVRQAVPA